MTKVLFSARVRSGADPDAAMSEQVRLLDLLGEDPALGYGGVTSYMNEAGEFVNLATFGSPEAFDRWRKDAGYLDTMECGRADQLDAYWSGQVLMRMHHDLPEGQRIAFTEGATIADGPFTIVFGIKVREGADALAFQTEQFRMLEWLGDNPAFGFRDVRVYMSADGALLVIVGFDSPAGLEAWRTDPDHMAVMGRGRAEWLAYGWTGVLVTLEAWDRSAAG